MVEEQNEQYTEDPTDDELLEVEMADTENGMEKAWAGDAADALEKAGAFKYKSRKKVKGRWVYDYGEQRLKRKPRPGQPEKPIFRHLPPNRTLFEHIRTGKEFLAKHAVHLPQVMGEIKELAGPDAEVTGRVKTLRSALGKMVKKPKYRTVDSLQDGTGLRSVHRSVEGVKATVEKIRAKYKVLDEDNYIDEPQGDYRSHHLIIEGPGGLAMEVQVRTENQNAFADWCHDVYKPRSKEQAQRCKHPDVVNYSKQMSEFFWQADLGLEPPPKPPCTKVVSETFGCL